MEAINRCRIYLQVIFVSDITEYNGREILDEVMQVKQFRPSTLNWSRQIRPLLRDRRTWRKYVAKLCYNQNNLIISLGKWIAPAHQVWPYMVSEDMMSLLRYEDGSQ